MNSYRDLDIYRIAFDLAARVHKVSLKLPKFELYEQGSQIRRSSKSIKDQIAEGYGRRRYKVHLAPCTLQQKKSALLHSKYSYMNLVLTEWLISKRALKRRVSTLTAVTPGWRVRWSARHHNK